MTDFLSTLAARIEAGLTYSETTINSFFTGAAAAEAYVVKFFQNEGPILITASTEVKAVVDALAVTLVGVPEVTQAAAALDSAIVLFQNLVSGLVQGATQTSPAESLVAAPNMRAQLTALRRAQSALDTAKATAASVIARYGLQRQ